MSILKKIAFIIMVFICIFALSACILNSKMAEQFAEQDSKEEVEVEEKDEDTEEKSHIRKKKKTFEQIDSEQNSDVQIESEKQEYSEDITITETTGEVTLPVEETQYNASQGYTTLYVVNCNKSISLRTAPSTSATAIRQIPLGAAVSLLETSTDGFYKVAYMGNVGYSLASYLSTDPSNHYVTQSTTAAWNSNTSKTEYLAEVVNCRQSITLRDIPKTTGYDIIQIPLGSVITVYNNAETVNGFYYVSYDGYFGYSLASYIDVWY